MWPDTGCSDDRTYADDAKGAAADEVKGGQRIAHRSDEWRSGFAPRNVPLARLATCCRASDSMTCTRIGEMFGAAPILPSVTVCLFGGAALVVFAATRFAKASETVRVSAMPMRPTK